MHSDSNQSIPNTVQVKRLPHYLIGYDAQWCQELVSGFLHGCHLHFKGPPIGLFSQNLQTSFQHPDIVDL